MESPTGDSSNKRQHSSEVMGQSAPQSPTLKRRHEESDEMGEKRQRVGSGPSNRTILDDTRATIVAQAAAASTQGIDANVELHDEEELDPDGEKIWCKRTTFISDPQTSMRILSLPVLESLSTQMLSTLAQGPYSETIRLVTEPRSDSGQAYATLKTLFDQTRKIYSRQAPFLSADELNIRDPEHRATIRTTNLATFVSSVFGGQDVGFYELNDHFIETFTPDGESLKKVPGELCLNLKTQMYLSAVSEEEQERTKEDILEDLFPLDLEKTLIARHPEIPLSQSELQFAESSKARREFLLIQPSNVDAIQLLSEKFAWEDFLRSLSIYLCQAYELFLAPFMKRHSLTVPAPVALKFNHEDHYNLRNGEIKNANPSIEFDINALAQQAAQEALQAYGKDRQHQPAQLSGAPYQNGDHSESPAHFPPQTQPTRILLEKAREAHIAKLNPTVNPRRPGVPSQRRPWSTEEENALMAGLDSVRGPHWSQILAMYGSKGSVNEVLRDRNQVQLKDKARNLKLFFLKSEIEVPYYLQSVTGELKTRAPTNLARREQEERYRLGSEDDRARYDGIISQSQGLFHPPISHQQSYQERNADESSSPEVFQVVEPEVKEDEKLRQALVTVTRAESHEIQTTISTRGDE